jgi:predicted aldo/keto reductase-like oxidoreductase
LHHNYTSSTGGLSIAKKKAWKNRSSSLLCWFWWNMLSQISMDKAVKVVQRAFELGINYFDSAKLDGDSEQKIGTLTTWIILSEFRKIA